MFPADPSHCPAGLRFLLIDDHPAVRQGLNLLLESNGYSPGVEAGTRADAKECLEQATFDFALLDLSLADGSGLDLLVDLAEHGVRTLIYSMHEDPGTIDRALRCGADGYVTKLADYCREHGMVFIADEVQSGFCRTGDWFASDHEGVVPDLITTAKGIAGGMPLAAVTGRAACASIRRVERS